MPRARKTKEQKLATRRRNQLAYRKRRLASVRGEIIEALGAWCAHCGIDDRRVLQVDHINGDGYKRRRGSGAQGKNRELINSLRQGDVGRRYQVLCANCHVIKTIERGENTGKQRINSHEYALPLFDQGNQDRKTQAGEGGGGTAATLLV